MAVQVTVSPAADGLGEQVMVIVVGAGTPPGAMTTWDRTADDEEAKTVSPR